jgi:hypothetical protein
MVYVKFAMVCDLCNTRGPEYEPGVSCMSCDRDICPDCAVWREDCGASHWGGCWECRLADALVYYLWERTGINLHTRTLWKVTRLFIPVARVLWRWGWLNSPSWLGRGLIWADWRHAHEQGRLAKWVRRHPMRVIK